jgi:hypothetical protein
MHINLQNEILQEQLHEARFTCVVLFPAHHSCWAVLHLHRTYSCLLFLHHHAWQSGFPVLFIPLHLHQTPLTSFLLSPDVGANEDLGHDIERGTHFQGLHGHELKVGAFLRFILLFNTWLWTQGLVFARQVLYCLSHTSSPGYFEDRILLFARAGLDC